MKTEQATGLTGVAQSGWAWNTVVVLLAGGSYFFVSKTVAGAPNARIHWPAGAAALAVFWAGMTVRDQLLYSHVVDQLQASQKRIEELPDEVEAELHEKIRGEEEKRYSEKYGERIATLVSMCTSQQRADFTEEKALDLVDRFCKREEGFASKQCHTPSDSLLIPKFKNGRTAGLCKLGLLGQGGVKKVFAAALNFVSLDGKSLEREDDCAWIETEKVDAVRKQYEMLLQLEEHPNVNRPWATKLVKNRAGHPVRFIAIEYLFPLTLKQVQLSWKDMISCLRQIASGVVHLHKNLIVHRDLKPANILIKVCTDGSLRLVISDFDFAHKLEHPNSYCTGGNNGTLPYMAPEYFFNECWSFKVDVWSLAVIAYELVWRSAGELAPTEEAKFPDFILQACQSYQRVVEREKQKQQARQQAFGFFPLVPMVYESPFKPVGSILCGERQLDWPKKLPKGGDAIKKLIDEGLQGSTPAFCGMSRQLGRRPVDWSRSTAQKFLEGIPSDDEL